MFARAFGIFCCFCFLLLLLLLLLQLQLLLHYVLLVGPARCFIRAKRVSNCCIPKKKYVRVSCVVCTASNVGFKGVVKTLLLSHATTGGVQKGSVNALS